MYLSCMPLVSFDEIVHFLITSSSLLVCLSLLHPLGVGSKIENIFGSRRFLFVHGARSLMSVDSCPHVRPAGDTKEHLHFPFLISGNKN
jgi:hypothetical protein